MERNKLKQYLQKYEAGETSLAEEKELKEYFRWADSVPQEFAYARDLFAYFEEARTIEQPQKKVVRFPVKRWVMTVGIAASLLIAGALGWYQYNHTDQEVLAYVDGKPVTDKEQAIAETQEALFLISSKFDQGTRDLNKLKKFESVQKEIRKNK